MSRPLIANQATATVVGWGLLVAGFVVLYGAYEGRGGRKPWWAGPLLPF